MKKIIAILGIAASMMAVSCMKEEIKVSGPEGAEGHKIQFVGATGADTKLSIGDKEGSAYNLLWNTGDVIGIFTTDVILTEATEDAPAAYSGKIPGELAELFEEDNGKTSGMFQTYNTVKLDEAADLIVTYPGSSLVYSDKVVSGTVPAMQEQRRQNSSNDLGKYAVSYAKSSLEAGQTEGVKFNLEQQTAFVKLVLSTSSYSDLKLIGARLACKGEALSGQMKINTESGGVTYAGTADYVGVKYRTPVDFTGTHELYFTALPCDLTGKDCYVIVEMGNDSKTVTMPIKVNGGELRKSGLSVISVSGISETSNEFKWFEPEETRYVAAYGQGWSYGPANTFVAYCAEDKDFGEAVTFDVKARGNFMKCAEPSYICVHNACEANISNKNVLEINGVVCHDGTQYVKIPIDKDTYTISVRAKAAGSYTAYSSKVKVFDENDNCIWAFNIWENNEPLVEQTYKNGVMLDRNIGSSSHKGQGYTSGTSYYQWGRPFQTGWSASGGLFDKRLSDVSDLSVSAANPHLFYFTKGLEPSQGGDWYIGAHTGARSEHLDDLWGNPNTTGEEVVQTDGTKSIYDPCPKGWMVASPKILAEISAAAEPKLTNYADNGKDSSDQNFLVYTLPDGSKAEIPFAGCKWGSDGGNPDNNERDICSLWSNSTITSYEQSGTNAYLMYYRYKEHKFGNQNANRAHGHAVRCMKDIENR
ncbi:MAG: hypothetical protein ACI3ZQ_11175 [Candidatus Cryptobacteroides sp.]